MNSASNNSDASSLQRVCFHLRDAVPYIYLLRVQLTTVLILVFLPLVSLDYASNLLRGIFDVRWFGMIFITLGAVLASWTVIATVWQVLLYGPERFAIRPLPACSKTVLQVPTRARHSPVFALFALPIVLAVAYESHAGGSSTYLRSGAGVLIGAFLAARILTAGGLFRRRGWWEGRAVTRFLSFFGPGFKKDEQSVHEGHYLALRSFLICLLAYVVIGFGKFMLFGGFMTHDLEGQPAVPTLANLLVLLMILCWGLSAITFILDRFRLPVVLPFILLAIATSHVRRTDHYFYVVPAPATADLLPAQVIRAGKPGTSVIVVAASGGGIKAAAWTARVLMGLEEDSRAAFPASPRVFGESIRLISAVSGGSVGAMYFVNDYDANGWGLPSDQSDLESVVYEAEASDLDNITWGLVYPDFLRTFLPVFKNLDRGQALEATLTRELPNRVGHLSSPLGKWREGVLQGWRPAVIFNATVVETGQPLLLGTTDLQRAIGRTSLRDFKFAGGDIRVVTAARLSATFPYVSPAARPDIPQPQIHVVDGGYTDNYGMDTLLAWLDEALGAEGNSIRRVLIIEIRASPPASEVASTQWRGWPFQSYAPATAILNVRDTGQLSRNEEELSLLSHVEAACHIEIQDVVFDYPAADAPLSWHLSPNDEEQIKKGWTLPATVASRNVVRKFLRTAPPAPAALFPACP